MRDVDVFGRPGAVDDRPTLGVMLPVFGTLDGTLVPSSIAEAAVYGERHGLDGLWLGDHLVHPLPLLESIVTLEHVATLTSEVRIGSAVMLLALRNPLVAAKQLATIAAYHPGRLTLGIGVGGEHPGEFLASGVPLDRRAAVLEEAAEQVRALWRGESVPLRDAHDGVRIAPRPSDVPLLFGGHVPPALRRAARLGDGWVGFYKDPAGFADARAALLREREALGRGEEGFPLGMVLPTLLDESNHVADERAAAFMRGASTKDFQSSPARFVLAGTADRVLERIAEYHRAGCRHFVLAVLDQGPAYLEQLEVVCERILPGVKDLEG